ncbi:MAG: hypothetical protein M3362_21905 [Acidobacteriota bacterium]|nr:hypothetical protein [Acidobacteriota bacterium]
MKKAKRDYEDDEREAKIVTACALRIDGYRYADEHGLAGDDRDYSLFVRRFLADPDYGLPRGHLHCVLLLLQRAYLKEGWLRWDSHEAKVIRGLFLALCREDPPEEYRDEGFYEDWERRHRPGLAKLLEFVRQRHERTVYRR